MITSQFNWNHDSILELSHLSSGYIYYRTTRLNLVSGYPEVYPFDLFLKSLSEMQLQGKVDKPRVYHFQYELGLLLMGLGHTVEDNVPLVIELEYDKRQKKKKPTSKLTHIPLKTLERPTWGEYKSAFAHIQEQLLEGSGYQVNLTYPFDFQTESVIDPRDISSFFFSRKGLGAYAHMTYLGDQMILSNSPECLFQYRQNEIFAMPIKGTMQRKGDWKKQWAQMLADPKEEAELVMITDLLRNDLNRLSKPCAKVKKLRAPMLVPGLLHQYSLISLRIIEDVSLLKTMECLFPGGSVTGAPKKRVMEIIQSVERYSRGIYCGSTLLCLGKDKVASINIRTASIDLGERIWRYGAGGGITLLSKPVYEFQEMESKVKSFLTLLKAPGF